MASVGPASDAARAAFRERIEAKGHAVANAREAAAGLEPFAAGALVAPGARLMLGDLDRALEADDAGRSGKSEAALHPPGHLAQLENA
jgi:hypothetical protein